MRQAATHTPHRHCSAGEDNEGRFLLCPQNHLPGGMEVDLRGFRSFEQPGRFGRLIDRQTNTHTLVTDRQTQFTLAGARV